MRLTLAVALVFVLVSLSFAQAGRRAPASDGKKNEQSKPAESKSEATKPAETKTNEPESQSDGTSEEVDDDEAVKVETNLVTLPVIVSDRGGRYVPDLKAEEFNVSEDGAEQKVSFFATVSEPFHVVLLIDTSASTTAEKMQQVQDAAVTFVNNLQADDRVKVISFDDGVRVLSDFTGDRAALASAIRATRPGKGTRLYDAFDLACRSLRRVKGRKAVVMLTDGVDWHSDSRTYDDNRRALEESDVVVYPVRFDTRAETEQLAREQQKGGQSVDLGTVLGGKAPTLPGGVPVVIGGRRRTSTDPRRGGDPSRDASRGGGPGGTDTFPTTTSSRPEDREDESVRSLMDRIYKLADEYLNEMANTSGGRLVRADNNMMLPRAFQQIAEELRTQYSLGYYPANAERSGKYRKIRVRTTRKDAAVRTRPGYRK
ncbi:MAG TPA: VWA domain-containing protein [Pyrinomonadaceae bacterium]|jgi:VWFA-related protein|nr:VWA domain-containing protein [Pyrinomonadaceae bacterium]